DEEDMAKALATPARFIGINNRNLKYFQTTIQNTLDLLPVADRSRILISESGIHTLEEAKMFREACLQGILVGEGLSTAPDVEAMTRAMAQL
ncbi:MAG: indole-3-glycerol phosphate synthase, partial [Anaerovibrio sp.]|nr:indole-3-glycerol phosphate synthase [Anaerovibrio sp.]